MEPIPVKIFATALALSQVATTPDAVRTRDQEHVAELLHAGCTHMGKPFLAEHGQWTRSGTGWSSTRRLLVSS